MGGLTTPATAALNGRMDCMMTSAMVEYCAQYCNNRERAMRYEQIQST